MTTEAKVGVFVIASALVLASATYFVQNAQTVRGQVTYNTHLRNAGGLAPGAGVLFGGIKVGQVTAVRPWAEDPTRIEIRFAVKSGTPLNQKSTASVGAVSIMATPALMITTGSNEAGRLSAGALVPSAESVSLEEIQGRVAKVAESADALLSGAPDHDPDPHRRGADVSRESEPDQRCTEPEKNRANPWWSQHRPGTGISQDRAHHRPDIRLGETRRLRGRFGGAGC